MVIGVIDYGAGNLRSLTNALQLLRTEVCVSSDRHELERCEKLIFPGVGEARSAMEQLRQQDLAEWLQRRSVPLLGICLGLQLLFDHSTERSTDGLALLPGTVTRFRASAQVKVPHMGWNSVEILRTHPLFDGIRSDSFFYFVHSYHAPLTAYAIASSVHGVPFASAVAKGNVMGVQFHPEKSGQTGLQLLRNFVEQC